MFRSTSPWSTKFSPAVQLQPAYAHPTYQINKLKKKRQTSFIVFYKTDQPCFVFIWAFIFRVRLKTTWQTGHLVFPLCTSLCLYREPRFRNFFPQILHWCPSMRGTMFTPAMPCQSQASPTHRHSTNRKRSKSIVAIFLYSNPCFATMWRFMWSMRLRRTLQIGQRVFPLCTLLCL